MNLQEKLDLSKSKISDFTILASPFEGRVYSLACIKLNSISNSSVYRLSTSSAIKLCQSLVASVYLLRLIFSASVSAIIFISFITLAILPVTFPARAVAAFDGLHPSNANYWYSDADIRAVVRSRTSADFYMAPAIAKAQSDIISDISQQIIDAASGDKVAMVPVNQNSNHWSALVVRKSKDGRLQLYYNDSLGGSIGSSIVASGLVKELEKKLKESALELVVNDLQVIQQSDSSSCGAYAAENLVTIANINIDDLTPDNLSKLLSNIKPASELRKNHLPILMLKLEDNQLVSEVSSDLSDKITEIRNNLEIADRVGNVIAPINVDRVFASIADNEQIISNRLGGFALSEIGVASGDNMFSENIYGVWLEGFLARSKGSRESSGNLLSSSNSSRFKARGKGITIGVDSKIDDDLTIGSSFTLSNSVIDTLINSNEQNSSASSSSEGISNLSIKSKIKNYIFSLYGSNYLSEDILIELSASGGKIYINQDDLTSSQNTQPSKVKINNDIYSGRINLLKFISLSERIDFIPEIGASYSRLITKPYQYGKLKIAKSTYNKLLITPGVRVALFMPFNSFDLIPEFRVNYGFIVKGKEQGIDINMQGTSGSMNYKLPAGKNHYQLGANLKLAGDVIELDAGANWRIENKARSNVVYARVRFNC